MTSDSINGIFEMKYDHRNLLTEFRKIVTTPSDPPSYDVYLTEIKYDDAGLRVRKKNYLYSGPEQYPVFNEDSPTGWTLQSDEYYLRDVSGKEIATYESSSLERINIYGFENEGYLDSGGDDYFYLKDHLGSVRVVLDEEAQVYSAQDFDGWGYLMEGREYNSEASKYKYTGKERDEESGYDYFGARYYDSRIGRWGQTEPLVEKYISFSPYCYGVNNPIIMIDHLGMDVFINGSDAEESFEYLKKLSDNLTFERNKKTGKISVTGKASNMLEKILVEAINNEKIHVNLLTTKYNATQNDDGTINTINVGLFDGSYVANGITYATQYFNLELAKKYEDAGGSSVEISLMHEIDESYISAKTNPGPYTNERYNQAHNYIENLEDIIFPGIYRPQIAIVINRGEKPTVENFVKTIIFHEDGTNSNFFDKLNLKK